MIKVDIQDLIDIIDTHTKKTRLSDKYSAKNLSYILSKQKLCKEM